MKNNFKAKLSKTIEISNKNNWYRIEAKAESTDVYIYDEISWIGISAEQFVKEINMIKSPLINLHLNTPGGNVFDGVTIANALKQHPAKVTTYIDGIAASIGSIIALSGDTIKMADNGFIMIHNPFMVAVGDSEELRQAADVLDKIKGNLIKAYVNRTGKSEQQVIDWLDAETWFTAEEALDNGFIDEIIGGSKTNNSYDMTIFDNPPEALLRIQKEDEDAEQKYGTETMKMKLELASYDRFAESED